MSNISNVSDLVTIGIATKNRWKDLQITLKKIVEVGLSSLKIIIFDDGSDEVCPFDLDELSVSVELQRFVESQGYIARRNQLAKYIKTKYYLSLDDDSFPVISSLAQAVEFAESLNNNVLCLSFPIFNPVLKKYESQSQNNVPYQVRAFIGCGHLLHRENFLAIGGYREELIHQGEEMEIAARAFSNGLYCYHFPDFLIHHTASNAGRDWHRMDFYGARNNLLWNDWFVPLRLRPTKQIKTITSRLSLAVKVRRIGQIQGIFQGLKDIDKYHAYRYPMSRDVYQIWRSLPHS